MFTTRPELLGTFGVAASTHWLASATAMAVLEEGGNAFDAAVAAGFALQVVEPHLNGPGGEVPALMLYDAREEPGLDGVEVICGQGRGARPAATIDALQIAKASSMVPGSGLLATVRAGRLRRLDADRCATTAPWTPRQAPAPMPSATPSGGYAAGRPMRSARPSASGRGAVPRALGRPRPRSTCRTAAVPEARQACSATPALAATVDKRLHRRRARPPAVDREAQIEAMRRRIWYQEGFVAEAMERLRSLENEADGRLRCRRHRGVLTGDDMAQLAAPPRKRPA